MAKAFWVFLGLLLVVGAVAAMGYRLQQSPDLITKYERMIEPETAQPQATAPKTRSAAPSDQAPDAVAVPNGETSATKSVDNFKMLEIALDVGNILVGLIGIYLAVSGMRMRRESQT